MKKIFAATLIFMTSLLTEGFSSEFYISSFGGINWLEQSLQSDAKAAYKSDAVGALAIGFKRPSGGSRMEIEGCYRKNPLEYFRDKKGVKYDFKGRTETRSFFVNSYYDFNILSRLTLFFGLGTGYTFMKLDIEKLKIKVNERKEGLSTQYIMGAKTLITEKIDLGFEYRYFLARGDYREQNIDLLLTYNF